MPIKNHDKPKNSVVIKIIIVIDAMYFVVFGVLYAINNKSVPIIANNPEITRINPNKCAAGGEILFWLIVTEKSTIEAKIKFVIAR
ncbi:MAG: hypothetical protein EOP00_29165 [Pedobacter sp.]|nr:MAG: hypothetical protein EOP00_29165 [Pedobacter sp.]